MASKIWSCEVWRSYLLSWLCFPPADNTGLKGLCLSSIFSHSFQERKKQKNINGDKSKLLFPHVPHRKFPTCSGDLIIFSLCFPFAPTFVWLFWICLLGYFLFTPTATNSREMIFPLTADITMEMLWKEGEKALGNHFQKIENLLHTETWCLWIPI